MYSLSIVIPAYNEEARLQSTLDKVDAFIKAEGWNAEVVIVDDGSTDGTVSLVQRHAQHKPYLRLLCNPVNRGKGFSLRHGIEAALGDVILLTDADLSVPIQESKKLLKAIEDGADVAIGSRGVQIEGAHVEAPWHRRFCSAGFKLVVRSVLRLRFEDTQCGFKAFKRKAARLIFSRQRIERWGFDPEALTLAERFCYVVKEVGVESIHDDRSKLNLVRDSFQMLCEVLKVRYHVLFGMYGYPTPGFQTASPAVAATTTTEQLGAASASSN